MRQSESNYYYIVVVAATAFCRSRYIAYTSFYIICNTQSYIYRGRITLFLYIMYNINIHICELPLGQIRRMDCILCINGRKSDQLSKCYYCRLTSLCTRIWIASPGFWSIRRAWISFYRLIKIQIVNYTSFVYIYI